MKKPTAAWTAQYEQCRRDLCALGYVSQGSVYARPPGRGGSRYQWSWKNAAQKTESLTLSREQYAWLKKANANQRKADAILARMRAISRNIVLQTIPGPTRRK